MSQQMKITYVMLLTEDIRNMHQRIQFLYFEAAGREGFQAVECDIHETAKDKKGKRRFVIMHDQTLNRMCGLSGKNIYQKKLKYQKIQSKYHIKTGKQYQSYTKKQLRMPSLEEENRK